jgi:hypothetical protein
MKHTIYALTMFALAACTSPQEEAIDRHALVTRNNPEVTAMDSLSSLSVGNGEFAYTVDATGLQTFPEVYKNGVPLGTQSQWGWHSFGNPENYKPEEALVEYDFGHGHKELYATQPKEPGRAKEAYPLPHGHFPIKKGPSGNSTPGISRNSIPFYWHPFQRYVIPN